MLVFFLFCWSNRGFLYRILEEVIKDGATIVSILDSVEYTYPDEFENFIAGIKEKTLGIENAIVSTHCQSGHGFATAYTLAGARAGARQLEVTINSLGERVGNTSLQEVVMAIKFRGYRMASIYTGISCTHIAMTTKVVNWQLHKYGFGTKSIADGSGTHKGLLGFMFTLAGMIFVLYSFLSTFSFAYPGTQKALVTFDDTETIDISFINIFSWIGGSILLGPFSSHFKDGESIDHPGFDIFIWLVFVWLLLLIGNICATLHIFLKIPAGRVFSVGVAVFCIIVLVFVPYIEHQRPTIVSKWAKQNWKKITGCCVRLQNLPRWFRQAYSWFCAKLSCVWDISKTEDGEASPSCYSMDDIESGPLASP